MKILILALFFTSCSKFVEFTDSNYHEEVSQTGAKSFNIFFSHNINGETHPCGCRQFPLGGMAQVNGILKSEERKTPHYYVDSGDTLFEVTTMPDYIKTSAEHKARKVAEGLDKLGLKLFTPGDQDFAMGEDFLKEISLKHEFEFLITNSSKDMQIKHKKFHILKVNERNIVFLGILNPDLLNPSDRKLFINPKSALKTQLKKIKHELKDLKNKYFILLSHSGIDYDRSLAKDFSEFSWIIGAHTQSYLRYSEDIGTVKIVQTLSRNHHLGKISLPFNSKGKEAYTLIETRDDTKDLIKNNEMIKWLGEFKQGLEKINLKEQESLADYTPSERKPTYITCTDCHKAQVDFWQETPHSLAYLTLVKANEEHNPKCISCHSLGFQDKNSFISTKKIILTEAQDFNQDEYIDNFIKNNKVKFPIREQGGAELKKTAKAWLKSDVSAGVTHSYANVQCLHCHSQDADHPFSSTNKPKKQIDLKSSCIKCHDSDQSPSWYNKDSKGLATSLNEQYFAKKLKEVSCPKIE